MNRIISGHACFIRTLCLSALLLSSGWVTSAEELASTEIAPANEMDAAADPASDSDLYQDSERYLNEIERLETSEGVYDGNLGESLLGLGLIYQRQGKHKEALAVLTRAMQIRRVNEGLQNMNQLALLENIMESNSAIGDWEELDKNYQQMLWLHRRNFDPDAPEFIKNLVRLGRWKVEAARSARLGDKSFDALRDTHELYSRIMRQIEKQHGKLDPRMVELHYVYAMINYELMLYIAMQPLREFQPRLITNQPVMSYERICYRMANGGVTCEVVPRMSYQPNYDNALDAQNQKDTLMRGYGLKVRHSLEQIFEIAGDSQNQIDDKHIRSLVGDADWTLPKSVSVRRQDRKKGGRGVLERLGLKTAQLDVLLGAKVSREKDSAEKGTERDDEQDDEKN